MFKKKADEYQIRQSIVTEIYKVQQDILSESISWSPDKLAIIRDCFDISAKIASGFETKRISL